MGILQCSTWKIPKHPRFTQEDYRAPFLSIQAEARKNSLSGLDLDVNYKDGASTPGKQKVKKKGVTITSNNAVNYSVI